MCQGRKKPGLAELRDKKSPNIVRGLKRPLHCGTLSQSCVPLGSACSVCSVRAVEEGAGADVMAPNTSQEGADHPAVTLAGRLLPTADFVPIRSPASCLPAGACSMSSFSGRGDRRPPLAAGLKRKRRPRSPEGGRCGRGMDERRVLRPSGCLLGLGACRACGPTG